MSICTPAICWTTRLREEPQKARRPASSFCRDESKKKNVPTAKEKTEKSK